MIQIKTLTALALALAVVIALLPSTAAASNGGCGGGAVLTKSQLICVAKKAGWKGGKAVTAAKVALAESGGDSKADVIVKWGGAREHYRGLFMISTKLFEITKKCALNALCNANFAHDVIYKKQGFSAWYGYSQIKR